MVNRQMINSWQTITRGSCVSKAWKPPSSRAILIYFEFRSKPSLITVICMDPHSPNKLFATKNCFLILGDDSSFFFLIISLLFVFFSVILLLLSFIKNLLLLSFYLINFFSWKSLLFFHVPGYSGMFRRVPECSVFRILSTPLIDLYNLMWLYDTSVDLKPCSCNLPIIKLYILEYILGLHSSFRLR